MSDTPIYCQFKAVTFEQIELRGSRWNPVYSLREDYRIGYRACGTDCAVQIRGTHGSYYGLETHQVPEGELVVLDGNTATIPIFGTAGKKEA